MNIVTKFENGYIPDRYSKYTDDSGKYKNQPIISFPFSITEIPEGVKYFAFTLIDHDSVPLCGFSWIHWLVANVPVSMTEIPENYSRNDKLVKIQGTNSFVGGETDKKIINRYIGPTPPDKDHDYTFTVYAVNDKLNLEEGFTYNQLYKEVKIKMVSQASIDIKGRM
jgi:Raf kinase inhibitor-like YbhB/YbcL family protein